MGKTKSTGEALSVLERHRQYLIHLARCEAVRLIWHKGQTTSRDVREVMELDGVFERYGHPDLKDFWLGAVFNHNLFEHTGEQVSYGDSSRNIHERTVKVWKLRDPAAAIAWLQQQTVLSWKE